MNFAFIIICCSPGKNPDNGNEADSSKQSLTENKMIPSHQNFVKQKDSIQGTWATSESANMSFRAIGDSLYFFEDPVPVFFEIRADSFIYYLDGEKFFNKILELQSDSIVFIENGDTIRLYNTNRK